MADRKPSKQRRQARNRAEREARAARSRAANTPAEDRRAPAEEPEPRRRRRRPAGEPEPAGPVAETRAERRERRRRERVGRDEIEARAREVIDASATDDTDAGDVAAVTPTPARRGSPVFSARHRLAVAEATADAAPARTHDGVAEATGVAGTGPGKRGAERAASGSARAVDRPATRRETVTRSGSSTPRATGSSRTTASSRAMSSRPTPSPRNPNRPPPRPMPAWLDRFGGNEPGGRWVMMSFAMVLMASIIINFVHIVPEIVEIDGKQEQTGTYFTIWHYGIGPGLYFLLPPVVILGLFILTARPWDRRRSWNIALACLVFITFITQSISIYIVPIGALAWGCWQARKAALEEVDGDPRVLREVERERRIAGREALRAARGRGRRDD